MTDTSYNYFDTGKGIIKAWTKGGDVDAVTISMARSVSTGTSLTVAAAAIAAGVLANTVLKAGVAFVLGSGRFRVIAGGALALVTMFIGALLLIRYIP